MQSLMLPGAGEADTSALPPAACWVPWHPNPARCTQGWLGQAHGSTSSKHLYVGIAQRPPGNKFPEGRLHFLAAHFLMLHFPCGTLLSLSAACDVDFHITLVRSALELCSTRCCPWALTSGGGIAARSAGATLPQMRSSSRRVRNRSEGQDCLMSHLLIPSVILQPAVRRLLCSLMAKIILG